MIAAERLEAHYTECLEMRRRLQEAKQVCCACIYYQWSVRYSGSAGR